LAAQQPGKKQDAPLRESLEEVKASVKSIGELFKKKDRNKEGNPGREDRPGGESPAGMGSTPSGVPADPRHIQGGRISDKVVYLEVDRFSHFNDGVAIVHKGNATAMINARGEMVYPYNVHEFFAIDNTFRVLDHRISHLGIFPYGLRKHFMNAKGVQLKGQWATLDFGSGFLQEVQELYDKPKTAQGRYQFRQIYMDRNARTHTFQNISLSNIHEGIGSFSRNIDGQWLHGYYRMSGEKIADPQFHEAGPFSDGMAVVGKRDAFGTMKYGYLNAQGELAIPLMFTKRPHPFSAGFAKVEPRDKSEFDYAFIDKSGKVVFSQSGMDKRKQGNFEFQPFQDYGLTTTLGNAFVMDTRFKIQTRNEFFEGFGIMGNTHFHYPEFGNRKMGKPGPFTVVGEQDPKIYFTNNEMHHDGILRGKELRVGFINLHSGTVVLPAFSSIGVFDPVSGLAYAELSTVVKASNGHTNGLKTIKGYINTKGEWVILQKEGGTW